MDTKNVSKRKLNNMWQTLLIIGAIFMAGVSFQTSMSDFKEEIQDAILTKEEVTEIAKTAAQEVIYDHEREVALSDCDDFVKGFLESDLSITVYINNTHDTRTRVYKGGLYLLDDDYYNLRPEMESRYGQKTVRDLINGLIDFTS